MTPRRWPALPSGIRRAFRLALGRPTIEEAVDEEVAFHLEMRAAELAARGMAPDAARNEAERRFGDLRQWSTAMATVDREHTAQRGRAEWLGGVARDLRYTIRGLLREPLFTGGVVATLALGVGANATMFGIVDQLLLRPPAYVVEPSMVRRLYAATIDENGVEGTDRGFGYAAFVNFRAESKSFVDLAAWSMPSPAPLGRGAEAREVFAAPASASLFTMLGVHPHLGRFYSEVEDHPPTGAAVVVIGHELWRTTFGGETSVLGRTITVDGADYQIVGVAPPGFAGIGLEKVDVWIPMTTSSAGWMGRLRRDAAWWEVRGNVWLDLVGRLRPGVTTAEAEAELAVLYPRFLGSGPDPAPAERLARTRPRIVLGPIQAARGPDPGASTRVTLWLLGVSAVVLIIACANVTNLLLSRATRRRREIAVQLAIGAGRGRLIRQLLLESVLLAAIGGVAGMLVARWGGGFVRALLLPSVAWNDTLIDPRVLLFTLVVVTLTGMLAGIAPAIQASQPDLTVALKAGAREGHGRRARMRTVLLVAQAALSVMLLVGAGLFVRSLGNASHIALGFDPQHVMRVEADLRVAGYSAAESRALNEQMFERVGALPGVASAALVATVPFYSMAMSQLTIPGRDSVPRGRATNSIVSPDYFAMIGTRLQRGRPFTDADREGSEPVAIVSEATARTLWPSGNALGQCVRIGANETLPCYVVVGVVEDVHWADLQQQERLHVYTPVAQRRQPTTLLFRTKGDERATLDAVRRVVYELAPRLTFVRLVPLAQSIDVQLRPWKLGASMFTAFGALALVIAAVGLYSMLAYTVTLRTHELGVRIALGASARDVLRLVIGDGMRVTLVGVALGVAGALLLAPRLESLLYGVTGRDPLVLTGVVLALLAVALAASLAPALRAARADPSAALRND
jgi:predicted permease